MENEGDHGEEQEQMNESARDVKGEEPAGPEDHKDDGNDE